MPEFTRGLAESGARVFGVGDQHVNNLPDLVKRSLSEYVQVSSLWDSGYSHRGADPGAARAISSIVSNACGSRA